jgi:small subunit ribosomal protein S6
MHKYELLYIIPTQFADTEIDGLREKVAGMITATGATVTRNESLGKIKLAYPIKHQRHGTYVLVYFTAEPNTIAGIDRQFRLSDEVLRHLIVDMPAGAENKKFEIASYVAPLSEEARELKQERRSTDTRKPSTTVVQPESVAPVAKAEEVASMSMEELDKKLDEILDADV